jgi:hypothetical protein
MCQASQDFWILAGLCHFLDLDYGPYRHRPHFCDSIGPSPTCPSIICTHRINGADGIASAATRNRQHKKSSSTANHQSLHCLFIPPPPIAMFQTINSKYNRFICKVQNCKSYNGKVRIYFISNSVSLKLISSPSVHYVHAQIQRVRVPSLHPTLQLQELNRSTISCLSPCRICRFNSLFLT